MSAGTIVSVPAARALRWALELAPDAEALRVRWRALERSHPPACGLVSSAWAEAWWAAFGDERTPAALIGLDAEGETRGIVPLQRLVESVRGFRMRTLALVENGTTPRAVLPAFNEPATLSGAVAALLEADGQWDLLALRRVSRGSPFGEALAAGLAASGRAHVRREALRSPVLPVAGSWEEYLATRSPKLRKKIGYEKRRIERDEQARVDELSDPEALRMSLPAYEELCARTWKEREGTGLTPPKRAFLRALADAPREAGGLVLWRLSSPRGLLAAELHLKDVCGTHDLRNDFDEAFGALSPGSVLESEVLKVSFDRGYREHDFCGDAYAYKMRWTSEVRTSEDVLVFSRRVRPALAGLIERRLVPKLKELRDRWRARAAKDPSPEGAAPAGGAARPGPAGDADADAGEEAGS